MWWELLMNFLEQTVLDKLISNWKVSTKLVSQSKHTNHLYKWKSAEQGESKRERNSQANRSWIYNNLIKSTKMVEPPDYLETRDSLVMRFLLLVLQIDLAFLLQLILWKYERIKKLLTVRAQKTWLNQPCTHIELSKLVPDVLYRRQLPLCEPTSAPFKSQQISWANWRIEFHITWTFVFDIKN